LQYFFNHKIFLFHFLHILSFSNLLIFWLSLEHFTLSGLDMFVLLKCRHQSRIVVLSYIQVLYYLTEQVNLRGRVSLTSTWISAMLESTEVGRHSAPSIIVGTCVIWPSFHRPSLSPPPRMNAGSLFLRTLHLARVKKASRRFFTPSYSGRNQWEKKLFSTVHIVIEIRWHARENEVAYRSTLLQQ